MKRYLEEIQILLLKRYNRPSYISTYNMSASDRREYEKQFGKYTDFNFKDIYKIEYRNKPIYIDDNFNEKESSIEEYAL